MKKILVVVDYQNDFVDGALGFPGAETLDQSIAEKIYSYGKGNVFYTLDTHDASYLETREGAHLPVVHCVKDTPGWEVYGKTKIALSEVDAIGFPKESFGLAPTEEVLQKLPAYADEIEFVGLVSNICVLSNVVIFQTLYPQAQIKVDASCTKSFDEDLHAKTLAVLKGLQVEIINEHKESKTK